MVKHWAQVAAYEKVLLMEETKRELAKVDATIANLQGLVEATKGSPMYSERTGRDLTALQADLQRKAKEIRASLLLLDEKMPCGTRSSNAKKRTLEGLKLAAAKRKAKK